MNTRDKIISADLEAIIAAGLPWEQLYGKTVLITGANGFLPAYMVKTLLRLNEKKEGAPVKIIALARNREKLVQQFGDIDNLPDFIPVLQDINEPLRLNDVPDIIIHAASQASPKYFGTDPVGTLAANTIGTYQLLRYAVEHKVSGFLFFSSGEVYGQTTEVPTREDRYGYIDIANVRNCYAESKRMAEVMCVSFAKQYGLDVKVVRPFHTYGPGMQLDDGRVYADFISDIVHNRNITINSDGTATRAFCYLSDATTGFFTVLLRGAAAEAYNVGNPGQELSIRQLAETLVGLFPEKKLSVQFNQSPSGNNYLASSIQRNAPDISKIHALGWAPTTPVAEGFAKTIGFYMDK